MKLLMLPGGICFTQLDPNLQRGSPELESRDHRCGHSLSPRNCHCCLLARPCVSKRHRSKRCFVRLLPRSFGVKMRGIEKIGRALSFSIPRQTHYFFLRAFLLKLCTGFGPWGPSKPTRDRPLPNSNERGKHRQSTRLLVRSCRRSGDAPRRAWSVETGISHLLSTSWMWFC